MKATLSSILYIIEVSFVQETLIIWGDQDNVFPLYMAYQLQRYVMIKMKIRMLLEET